MSLRQRLLIRYTSDPEAWREISAIEFEDERKIHAHCHLRNGGRSFIIEDIIEAIEPESGERFTNPWIALNAHLQFDGRITPVAALYPLINAVLALEVFSFSTRERFSQKERQHVRSWLRQRVDLTQRDDTEIDNWIKRHYGGYDIYQEWRNGDHAAYQALLKSIPTSEIPLLRLAAQKIALGSGRMPPNQEWVLRIENEFPLNTLIL